MMKWMNVIIMWSILCFVMVIAIVECVFHSKYKSV